MHNFKLFYGKLKADFCLSTHMSRLSLSSFATVIRNKKIERELLSTNISATITDEGSIASYTIYTELIWWRLRLEFT